MHTSWQDKLYYQILTSVAVLQYRVISFPSIQARRESFGSAPERGAQRLVIVPRMFDRRQCQG